MSALPEIELETDNFVSPMAANDVTPDGGIELEMDAPAIPMHKRQMLPIFATPAPVEVVETPAEVVAPIEGLADIAAETADTSTLAASAIGRATLGVGFSTAEGYIEALRRGVKKATRDEYVATLKSRWNVTIDFVVPLLDAVVLPVGEGITHTPTGPSIFDEKKASKAATKAKGNKAGKIVASDEDTARVELVHGKLIAGAVADGHGVLVGWTGAGDMTRAQFLERLATANVPTEWAITAKDPAVQLTRAVKAAGGTDYNAEQTLKTDITFAEGEREWSSQWSLVSGGASAVAVGNAFGRIALVVTLYTDTPEPELVFDGNGDALLCQEVREQFAARTGAEQYIASDITKWLAATLKTRCKAIRYGGNWYVAKKHRAVAESLVDAFKTWGKDWMNPPLPIATSAQLAQGLANGLMAEVDDELQKLEQQRATHREKHGQDAEIGSRAAQSFMLRFRAVAERVAAYAQLLGDECVAQCRDKVRAAMAELDGIVDDSGISERFANVWEEIERDIKAADETV